MKKELIVLIGPTAVGKTKLSIDLAHKLNAEIISGDSMQIYRRMDIGTAKITTEEMEGIPHHLIDIKDPDESFSVAEFQEIVRPLIDEIHARNKIPMIVGGTGLYIQSVVYDYQFADIPQDTAYRLEMEQFLEQNGVDLLHAKLQKVDPAAAERIHKNNSRRVIRALEIYHCTGLTMTEYIEKQEQEQLYNASIIGLTMDRDVLYERINKRVDIMVEQGIVHEVKQLYDDGIKDCQSIQAIGYKEFYDYFDGRVTLEEAVHNLKQNSRRYAKRQLTWFRNKMDVTWFEMTPPLQYEEKLNEILHYVAGKLKLKSNT
ncbi:tRNA (adenosine(37)-N6)-dimethylallyltransferase MiaA [Metabacillus fastidiosus]|uniref:tRNA (adenosine(37)-N6)-dimethylallyltransferase MiaA n=1 Tax=Metabacillus fastidiosus TaxID=1458 RepID=UPI002E239E10|nr:tRNA (adenosine(37)-N6)-dimethylallyltransferase MiaA [Metabacillus fastidiosus]MED4531204.1 tRNA (adenosine(37)-N6)-dimethylallyltransferase MiaA [Metabacillus fastidiosus]